MKVFLRDVAVAVGAIWLCGCLNPPLPETATGVSALTYTSTEHAFRACRQDTFFVDLPVEHDVPVGWGTESWRQSLIESIEPSVESSWFESTCSGDIRLVGRAVLSARSTPVSERSDGHLRFHRFSFVCEQAGETTLLKVRGAEICRVVNLLRGFAHQPSPIAFVGQECEATASSSGLESNPTPAMLDWHYAALGMSGPTPPIPEESESSIERTLLLQIDGGVHANLMGPLSATQRSFLGSNSVGGHHRHGSAMAVLGRQVAPNVDLAAYQAIDGAGLATGEAMAQAIDAALFETPVSQPLVMQLSLGWASQLAEQSGLHDGLAGQCQTWQDPFGEPVRYGLYLARRWDERFRDGGAGEEMPDGYGRPVFVVAAAGNRSGDATASVNAEPFPPVDPSVTPIPLSTGCYGSHTPGSSQAWFFPGQWTRSVTCRPGEELRTAFAVSAVDADYDPAVNAWPNAESPLVAVGQHVMARMQPDFPTTNVCSAQTFPAIVRMPAAMSGSSVSAALTAAAASQAQTVLLNRKQSALSADAMARLLYLTAEATGRSTSVMGAPVTVRRLNVGRLMQAVHHCPAVVECAVESPGSPIGSGTLAACQGALYMCGFDSVPPAPSRRPPNVVPTATYCGYSSAAQATPVTPTTCSGGCLGQTTYDRYLVGGGGPLPAGTGCPYCPAQLAMGLGPTPSVVVATVFELNPDLQLDPAYPFFRRPEMHLEFIGAAPNQTYKTMVVLSDPTAPSLIHPTQWVPGNTIFFEAPLTLPGLSFTPVKAKGELHLGIKSAQGTVEAVDVSPLVVNLVP